MTNKPEIVAVRAAWQEAVIQKTDKELLIRSFQVMQSWEYNYMRSLAALATSRGGGILEVGFGMGISAGHIQSARDIESHTIVECHPGVAEHARSRYNREIEEGRVIIHEGYWEDVLQQYPPESFNGILFDSCPLDVGVQYFHFFPFFSEAHRLLKTDGIFTYFSDEPRCLSKPHREQLRLAGFKKISYRVCRVRPPKECEYWKHNTIVTPIVGK